MEKADIKILLVDDTQPNIRTLSINLGLCGYSRSNIQTASNGNEAIEIAKTQIPNIIVMDTNMPGIYGYDACRQIKQQDYGKSIAVIGMSNNLVDYRNLWLEAGADDSVDTRSILTSRETLDAKIQEALKKYQQ